MMSALMWFWFQGQNINSSSEARSSYLLKKLEFIGATERSAVPV